MAKLYKYLSLKDEGLCRLEDMIENSHIYMSDGNAFNDPFDVAISEKNGKPKKKKGYRILCLTSSYRNRLMWAHYADSHKGVCLTIEVPDDIVYPVFYTKYRVYTNTNLDRLVQRKNLKRRVKKNVVKEYEMDTAKKLGYVKDSTWAYENEYRVVFYKKESNLLEPENFLKVKITNVYLGAFISNENKKRIKELCKDKKIPIKMVTFLDNSYSIKIN